MTVFEVSNKVHLCLITVKNQVISQFGGEANFKDYLEDRDGKFISATNDEDQYKTCCHPEALLNTKYHNKNTPSYAFVWDEIYTLIFGNPNSYRCQGHAGIRADETRSRGKRKRTSNCLLELSAKGEHPWQRPEIIERNRNRLFDLFANGKHHWQQPDFIEQCSKRTSTRQMDLSANVKHNFQNLAILIRIYESGNIILTQRHVSTFSMKKQENFKYKALTRPSPLSSIKS